MWWRIAQTNSLQSNPAANETDEADQYQYGEYFYDPATRESHSADVDTNGQSHDMVAQEHLINHMGYDLQNPYTDGYGYPTLYNDASNTFDKHLDGRYDSPGSQYENFAAQNQPKLEENGQWSHNVDDYLRHTWNQQRPANTPPEEHAAQGEQHLYGLKKRPREHVMENFGWVRIQGRNVEIASLEGRGWKDVYKAIIESYGNLSPNERFNVSVRNQGNRGYFPNVPLWVIDRDQVRSWVKQQEEQSIV
jgi:hypothetical protein